MNLDRSLAESMNFDRSLEDPEIVIERLRGRILELEDIHERIENEASDKIGMAEELAIARDAAETALRQHKEDQKIIEKLALYDPLTELSNRNRFARRFKDAIFQAKRNKSSFALLMLDLDRFKAVNDTFGHLIGDELLKFVAQQLNHATRDTDTVARLGGDEFALILTQLQKDDRASIVAARIIEGLSQPVNLDGSLVQSGTSIGISLYPRDGEDEEELLGKADKALYSAKSQGRGIYQFFNHEVDEQARAAHIFENDLRLAIVRNEFVLHYQPQLVPGENKVDCVEALARWQHPTRGLLLPEEFIGTAESIGLIGHVGEILLHMACRQCRSWIDDGIDPGRVAVNISPLQVLDGNFVKLVEGALKKARLDPSRLELEITETVMTEDADEVMNILHQLRSLGVSLCIDDFGIGFSSFSYLKEMPVQRLKVDRTFISALPRDHNDMSIAEAIVNLGQNLGFEIIAEGVETRFQENAVRQMKVDFLQGFLITPPLSPSDFSDWFARQTASPR